MIIDCIEMRVIKKLKSKAAVLIGLLIVLLILLFVFMRPGMVAEQVEIIEKYYPQGEAGTAIGIETNEVIDVTKNDEGSSCAMKFSNDKILEIDCDRYLDFRNHETVYIEYDGKQITDIRRKK